MPAVTDVIPTYVGADNIQLALADPPGTIHQAGRAILITITLLNEAIDSGLVAPLELNVQAPSGKRTSHVYAKAIPQSFAFTPHEGGDHLVTLREGGHCRWGGALLVSVLGDRLDA